MSRMSEADAIREELRKDYGQVWDTQELQRDFTVLGFAAPFVIVRRKSDGVEGTMLFTHLPRFYFSFVGERDEPQTA